jgi:nitrate/TMAO reductase-like tetraheme cytochrome c subunit
MIRNSRKIRFIISAILAVGLLLVTAASAFEIEECINCHQKGSSESRLTMDAEQFDMSIHADNATCVECHQMVEDEGHMETPGSGAVDCSQCHDQENFHGLNGDLQNRPQCSDCHTRHDIKAVDDPAASVHPAQLTATCGQCHPAQSGYTDYFSRLPAIKIKTHPKGDLSTDYKEDNCIGCHQGQGAHGEADPISEDRCYACHLTMEGEKALLGFIHPKADAGDQPGVFAVAIIYQLVVLVFIVGGVFFFIRKFSGT